MKLKKENEMVMKFIHLFKTFIEYLPCASHCAQHSSEQNKHDFCPQRNPLVEKTITQKKLHNNN